MSAASSRPTSTDLLTDLQVDLQDRGAPATRVAGRRTPALELTVTPLHWGPPRVRRSPTGLVAWAGPLRLGLLVRA